MTITQLHVDVLVHAGIHGPLGATGWPRLVEDPDEVGRSLFATRAAGRTEYVYRPLPFKLTAAEILKACSFYGYNASRGSRYITQLREAAEQWVVGFDEAPWGWTDDDITARSDREPLPIEKPVDPRLSGVVERLAAHGIHLELSEYVFNDLRYAFPASRRPPIAGTGTAKPFGAGILNPTLMVVVAETPAASETTWLWAVGTSAQRGHPAQVWQWGALTIVAAYVQQRGEAGERLDAVFATWPAPSRTWSTQDPPRQDVAVVDVRQRVEMSGVTHGQTMIARTAEECVRLADLITSPDIREMVAAVDADGHSVLALVGDDRVDDVASIQLHDTAWWSGMNGGNETALEIQCTKPAESFSLVTVIICERLDAMPQRLHTHPPGASRYDVAGPAQLTSSP